MDENKYSWVSATVKSLFVVQTLSVPIAHGLSNEAVNGNETIAFLRFYTAITLLLCAVLIPVLKFWGSKKVKRETEKHLKEDHTSNTEIYEGVEKLHAIVNQIVVDMDRQSSQRRKRAACWRK